MAQDTAGLTEKRDDGLNEPIPPVAVPYAPPKPKANPNATPITAGTPGAPQGPLTAVPASGMVTHQASDFGAQAPTQTPGQAPQQTALPPAPVMPQGPSSVTAPSLTPTNPNNPLTGQTIAPNAIDRQQLARQQFDAFVQGTDPAYQAVLRNANRMGAAQGRLGSGSLRTDFGNLADTRANALDVARQGFMNEALSGTVDDQRFATGVAQQQQGFQNQQQQQAFQNELQRLGFGNQLTNDQFGRALQTWMAGQAGGTGSGTILNAADVFGQGAQDASGALADLWRTIGMGGTPAGTPSATPTPGATSAGPYQSQVPSWLDSLLTPSYPRG